MSNNKVQIKSAGLVDGDYKVVLSNDMELDKLQFLDVERSVDGFGLLTLKILLPYNNKLTCGQAMAAK